MKNTRLLLLLIIIFISSSSILKSQTWIEYTPMNSGNPAWAIYGIIIDSTNAKWMATERGLVRFKNNNWTLWDSTNSPLPNAYIHSIAKDKTNNIWLATQNKGIFKFDGINWTHFYYTNFGSPLKYILKISFDNKNTLWACSFSLGLLKHIVNDHWIRYSRLNSGFPDYSANYVEFDGDTKWAGTPTQGIARYNDTNWVIYNSGNVPGLSNEIHGIAIDKNNNKWFCTRGGGLAKLNSDENQWTIYRTSNSGIPWNTPTVIYIDKKNNKWIANEGGGFVIYNDTNWNYNSLFELNTTEDFKEDEYGNMWIGQSGRLLVYNPNGVIGIDDIVEEIPSCCNIYQNYPNPFNPTTKINFSIQKQGLVTLKVYDMLGREVAALINETKNAGNYSIDFNASKLSSGIYFYKLTSGDFSGIKKMVLIK